MHSLPAFVIILSLELGHNKENEGSRLKLHTRVIGGLLIASLMTIGSEGNDGVVGGPRVSRHPIGLALVVQLEPQRLML